MPTDPGLNARARAEIEDVLRAAGVETARPPRSDRADRSDRSVAPIAPERRALMRRTPRRPLPWWLDVPVTGCCVVIALLVWVPFAMAPWMMRESMGSAAGPIAGVFDAMCALVGWWTILVLRRYAHEWIADAVENETPGDPRSRRAFRPSSKRGR